VSYRLCAERNYIDECHDGKSMLASNNINYGNSSCFFGTLHQVILVLSLLGIDMTFLIRNSNHTLSSNLM